MASKRIWNPSTKEAIYPEIFKYLNVIKFFFFSDGMKWLYFMKISESQTNKKALTLVSTPQPILKNPTFCNHLKTMKPYSCSE